MKRPRTTKASRTIDRLYKEAQCRDCAVVVTRMDFAKILGKFTKVKIQYENSSTSKDKHKVVRDVASPNSNARLKSNENGMVLIHRNAYNQHPVKEILSQKPPVKNVSPKNVAKQVSKPKDISSPKKQNYVKTSHNLTPRQRSLNNNNILKEINRFKKSPAVKEKFVKEVKKPIKPNLKRYGIIFVDPMNKNSISKNKITLLDLLPTVDKNILPSKEWSIEYLPIIEEPKEDKVYDRIAAELEDLMYNEKGTVEPSEKTDGAESKSDDFPSILDILNDNTPDNNSKINDKMNPEIKSGLASSDVEAMLLDESDAAKTTSNTVKNLVVDAPLPQKTLTENIEEPSSPSILDEALQKGIAEHLPDKSTGEDELKKETEKEKPPVEAMDVDVKTSNKDQTASKIEIDMKGPAREITHLVFKHVKDGSCYKSVICPKNLKYSIEFAGKPVELLGAPKYISSREDLLVLLQIVDESELESFYVLQ